MQCVFPAVLMEASSAELCCPSRYLAEPSREGRRVVPYLSRCHSQTEIKRRDWEEGCVSAFLRCLSMFLTACLINSNLHLYVYLKERFCVFIRVVKSVIRFVNV